MLSPGAKNIIIASFFFSVINALVKLYAHIPAIEIVFFRSAVTLAMSYAALRKERIKIFDDNFPLLLLRGVCGALGLSLFFYSIHSMPLATAVTIFYLAPVFTVLIAIFMNKESPAPKQWPFILGGFAGAALMKNFDPNASLVDFSAAIAAAFFAGLAYNFIRLLKGRAHHQLVIFFFPLATIPICLPFMLPVWKTPDLLDLGGLLLIGALTQLAQVFMTKAYMAEQASKISHYNYLTAIWALLTGAIFFNEFISPMAIGAMFLIIFCVIMNVKLAPAK